MIVAFTGIRDVATSSHGAVFDAVRDEVVAGATELRFGGARGSDTVALRAAKRIVDVALGSRVRIVAVVPFRLSDQPHEASEAVKQCADDILELALPKNTRLQLVAGYHQRNAELLRPAARVVAFIDDRTSGGTYATIRLARRRGLDLRIVSVRSR